MNNLDYHEKQIKYNMTSLLAQIQAAFPEDKDIQLDNPKYKEVLDKSAFNPESTGDLANTLGIKGKVLTLQMWRDLSNGWCPVDEKSPLANLAVDTPRGKFVRFNKTAYQMLPNGNYITPDEDSKQRRCGTEFLFCFGERLSTVLALRAKDNPDTMLEFKNLCMEVFNKEIMPEMLKDARVRLGDDGIDYQSATEILAVPFFHSENRSEQPFMHFHFDLLNVARAQDGKLYSLCTDEIGANASKYDAIFMASMKEKIERHFGLVLEAVKHKDDLENEFIQHNDKKTVSFDIPLELIPEGIVEYRSAREKEMEAALKEMGRSGYTAKEIARKESREEKSDKAPSELQALWSKEFSDQNWTWAKYITQQEEHKAKQDSLKLKSKMPTKEIIEESFLRNHKEVAFTEDQYKAHIVKQLLEYTNKENAMRMAAAIFEEDCVLALTNEVLAKHTDFLTDNIRDPMLRHSSQLKFNRDAQFIHKSTVARDKYISDSLLARKSEKGFMVDKGKVLTLVKQYEEKMSTAKRQFRFKPGQRNAINTILTKPGAVAIVAGRAGAGKSSLLRAAKEILNGEGYRVVGTSTQNGAVEVLVKDTGLKNGEAYNTTKLINLIDEGKMKLDNKTVIFWDEAGMADTKTYYELVKRANNAGSKICFVGESEQIQAVGAGGNFRDLTQKFDFATARVHEINRQNRHWQREMVEDFARGESRKAVGTLFDKGKLDFAKNDNERMGNIVEDYFNKKGVEYDGDIKITYRTKTGQTKEIDVNTLIVKAPEQVNVDPSKERVAVDKILRNDELLEACTSKNKHDIKFLKKAIYELTGDDMNKILRVEDNLKRTERELSFEEKLIVCPVNDKKNLLNERIREVMKPLKEGEVETSFANVRGTLRGDDVAVKIYGGEERQMAIGERILFTKTTFTDDVERQKLSNGDKGEIKGWILNKKGEPEAMQVTMEKGVDITLSLKKNLDIDYSYATTVHKSQGQTKEHVFYYVTEHMSNLHQAYVACSRNRDELKLYMSEEMVRKAEEKLEGKTPTESMIKTANWISKKDNVDLEPEVLESFLETRDWLNENYFRIEDKDTGNKFLDRYINVIDAMGREEFKKTSFDFKILEGEARATYEATKMEEQEKQLQWVMSGKNLEPVPVQPTPEEVKAMIAAANALQTQEVIKKAKEETLAKEPIKPVEVKVETKPIEVATRTEKQEGPKEQPISVEDAIQKGRVNRATEEQRIRAEKEARERAEAERLAKELQERLTKAEQESQRLEGQGRVLKIQKK